MSDARIVIVALVVMTFPFGGVFAGAHAAWDGPSSTTSRVSATRLFL